MADQIVSVVEVLLSNLSTILSEEGKLLGGLQQEVDLIKIEFSHMKAFLEVVDFNQHHDPQLKVWIGQVRKAAYETEDVLDEFTFLFARPHPRGFSGYVHSSFNCIKNLPARHRLASKLQSVKAKVKAISEARLSYESKYAKIPAGRLHPPNDAWRYSKDDEALHAKEAELVGIEKPKQHLISQLLEGYDSQLKVISVVGMGGIGKTTLVKKVYDDAAVKSRFQIRVWVVVSQTYDYKELLKALIRRLHASVNEAAPAGMKLMDNDELKAHIENFLQRARYAIVFDDVWDVQFWDAFKFVLPAENSYNGNRVMITTRMARVASTSCSSTECEGYIYRMGYLSFEASWSLFCRKTFKHNSCPAHLMDVAKSIVAKCEGLPLAIVAIGGVFASKELSRTEEWELALRRLGDIESEGTGKLDRAKEILRMSYVDLPSSLKSCLLHFGVYPEDHQIRCFHLIEWWIAERFVDNEEVGWNYLKELANRSLIIVDEFDPQLEISRKCRIHDLLREFIVSESREINFITIVDSVQQQSRLIRPLENVVRRLVFHGNEVLHKYVTQEITSRNYLKNVRSMITFDCTEPLSKALTSQLLSSKFLKILILDKMQLEEIPKEIFQLFHLTHLCLSHTRVTIVPKSIKCLPNLEFLDLRWTNVRELPKEILKLQKLRLLLIFQEIDYLDPDFGYYGFKAPCDMGVLSELQVLNRIDVSESDHKTRMVNEIGKLAQLRTLNVTNLKREDGKELCSSLEKLTNLRELSVASIVENDEVTVLDLNHPIPAVFLQFVSLLELNGRLEKMPPWLVNLKNLREIELRRCSLMDDEDPLESLQHLPKLVDVYLSGAYQGESLCFKTGGFPKLRKLWLRKMEALRWMRVEEGAMPFINELTLDNLPCLEELPFGTEHLRQLQKLEFWDVADGLITSKLMMMNEEEFRESEEYKRNAHIPQLEIYIQKHGKRYQLFQPTFTRQTF